MTSTLVYKYDRTLHADKDLDLKHTTTSLLSAVVLAMGSALVFVEWGARFLSVLGPPRLLLRIALEGDEGRSVEIEGDASVVERLTR